MVTGEWELVVEIVWRDDGNSSTLFPPLGHHRGLSKQCDGFRNSGNWKAAEGKGRTRVQNSRGDVSRSMGWHDESVAKRQADNSGKVEIAEKQASFGHYL
jgi:hypothetical protein